MLADRLSRCSFVILLAALSSSAQAQTGGVAGRITDIANGQGIPGARVQAIQLPSRVAASVLSGDDGSYRMINLAPGAYAVVATRIGYQMKRLEPVTVTDGGTATANVAMSEIAANLEAVVTSASKKPEKVLDAPASIAVIGLEEINARTVVSPVDHLRAVPGVDIASGGLFQANVVSRGFNNIFSGSLLTLVDNRFGFVPSLRVNVPYLSPTNNEDIERIEILLGPAAALYGPNSASGVLHFITRSPFDSKGTTLTLEGGTRDYARGAIRHAGAPNDKFGYKFSFDYTKATDWTSVDLAEQAIGVQRDFSLQKMGGEARFDFRPTPASEIIGSYGYVKAGNAIEPTGLGAAQVEDWSFSAYQLRGRWNQTFAQVFLNASDAGNTFLLRNAKRPDGGRIVDKSTQLVGQLQQAITVGTRQEFIVGADYIKTEPKTEGTINGRNEADDDISEYGGYIHSSTELSSRFDLVLAARYDKNSRLDEANVSPRAALVFKPTATQNIRATYNRAFSTPSTNNQFLDLQAGAIPIPGTIGYGVRTLGTPKSGFQFKRDCTGGAGSLCMRSPFTPAAAGGPATFVPANASGYYAAALAAVIPSLQANPQTAPLVPILSATLGPAFAAGRASIGTQLRVLNPTNSTFSDVAPGDVRDLEAIKPTITTAYELGYKGILGRNLRLAVDLWSQKRDNFVGPLIVETPNVFLDRQTLTTFLNGAFVAAGVPAAQAGAAAAQIATGMAGLSGSTNAAAKGVPLGVVNLTNPLNNPTDIVLAYRNFGEVDLWGADFAADVSPTPGLANDPL